MRHLFTFLSICCCLINVTATVQPNKEIDSILFVLKNKDGLLPLDRLNRTVVMNSFGKAPEEFNRMINRFTKVNSIGQDSTFNLTDLKPNDLQVITYQEPEYDSVAHSDKELLYHSLKKIPHENTIVVVFGSISPLEDLPYENCFSIIYCADTSQYGQREAAQMIMGARSNSNALNCPASLNKLIKSKGLTLQEIQTNGRLRYADLNSIGLKAGAFQEIDNIASNAIKEGAFPGCQVLVSVKGNIIYQKSFGTHTYAAESKKVMNDHVYDIASITKIAGSTLLAMYLEHYNLLDVNDTLGKYIPEITGKTGYGSIKIREMMAHQAGLKSWIPFYLKTLNEGELDPEIYQNQRDSVYSIQVADRIFIRGDYPEIMYERILRTPLGRKKYKYSDLCYYFTQKVIESIIDQPQNQFLHQEIYAPMGLQNMRYNPLDFFSKDKIVPTEYDRIFRKQLIHGHVHDPGAAMLGGVGGHAGIFSNAADLASIMQLFLKDGSYAGNEFFNREIREDFTRKQYPNNRRGIGFDRPRESGGGTCDILASSQSFGHSGFTGALAWADPKDEVIFIFLSNRVHPDQENWKIRDMNIRTDMQHVVYDALLRR